MAIAHQSPTHGTREGEFLFLQEGQVEVTCMVVEVTCASYFNELTLGEEFQKRLNITHAVITCKGPAGAGTGTV